MLELYSFPFSAMGSECNLHFYSFSQSLAEEVAQLTISEVARIEARFSRYDPDSVLSGINRIARQGGSTEVDVETGDLLDFARSCYVKSGKLFDITSGILREAWGDFTSSELPPRETIDNLLPMIGFDKLSWNRPILSFTVAGMELDLGGIGKEYASDKASDCLHSREIRHGLVDLGGDIRVLGPHPDGDPWLIGIRDPHNTESIMGNVEIARGALASSGDYERCIEIGGDRYSHIINPITGWPARGLAAVSVIANTCIEAGSICTVAMLKEGGGKHWLEAQGLPHLWVDDDGLQGGTFSLLAE